MGTPTQRPRARDLFLAVPLGALVLGSLHVAATRGPWSDRAGAVGPSAYLLAALAVLAVALRRFPQLAALLAAGATAAYLALGHPPGPVLLAVAVTSHSLARRAGVRRSTVIAAVCALALLLGGVLRDGVDGPLFAALPLTAWVVVPYSAGIARRMMLEARRRRRDEEERRVLDAERVRLASEVHDVVGHGLAAIQMQADIALHVADRRPEQAREALTVISRASAEALAELRATLAAITPDSEAADPRTPTPGLDRLEALCARMREAGIEVDLARSGTARALPSAADVAAYRIVQESLTNVVKHAAERRAEVRVEHGEAGVTLSVASSCLPGERIVDGFGITGMRRRAADVGGVLEITVDGSRVLVRAELPYVR